MNPLADIFANLDAGAMRTESIGEIITTLDPEQVRAHVDHARDQVIRTERHEEWHVTVKGHPVAWALLCREHDLKPLFIELQNGDLQLMCASSFDPRVHIDDRFTIIRVKHEVSQLADGETAVYYEAHAKFNGPWRIDRKGVSRDLYRANRWYMTTRSATPFDAEAFGERARSLSKPSHLDEVEYEVCILDTNRALDGGWL